MITDEEVTRIASLAKLEFQQTEIRDFTHQLNRILEYINQLNELDTAGVLPLNNPLPLGNALREDLVRPTLATETVIEGAPTPRGDFFSVPRIIE